MSVDLTNLKDNNSSDPKCNFAKNPKATKKLLDELSKDPNDYVRAAVARNPNSYKKTLQALSKDPDWYVRTALGENPNCPVSLLEILSKETDLCIISSVVENPNISEELLKKLAETRNFVKEKANQKLLIIENRRKLKQQKCGTCINYV